MSDVATEPVDPDAAPSVAASEPLGDVVLAVDVGATHFQTGLVTTRGVLIDRAWAPIEPDVGPESPYTALALIVTEMLERAALRHPLARRVDGGTFHHVAYRIVARHFRALGLARPPTVIDTDDAANAVAAVIQRLGLQRDRRARLRQR